jgi:hypothetical protein
MRFAWRSPKFFEQPGWFLVIGRREVCLIPFPRARK